MSKISTGIGIVGLALMAAGVTGGFVAQVHILRIKKALIAVCFIFLGVYAFRPRVRIVGHPEGYICALCPKGFKNNVKWVIYPNRTESEQWAGYINDASGGYCSVDWKWLATGKRSY